MSEANGNGRPHDVIAELARLDAMLRGLDKASGFDQIKAARAVLASTRDALQSVALRLLVLEGKLEKVMQCPLSEPQAVDAAPGKSR